MDATYRTSVVLLHLDGTDGATTITDNSLNASTAWSGQVSTTQKKFGTASFWQTGSRRITNTLGAGTLNLTADFTIDLWFFPTYNAGTSWYAPIAAWGQQDGAGTPTPQWRIFWRDNNRIMFYRVQDSVGENFIESTNNLALNTWHHIAVTRSGTTTRLFVNGVLQGSFNDTLSYTHQSGYPMLGAWVSWHGGVNYLGGGYIDEFRLLRGHAAFTSNFTPPTAPYANQMVALDSTATVVGNPTLPTAVANSCIYHIKNISNFAVNVLTTASQTIEGATSWSLQPSESISLVSDAANWRIF